MVKNLPSMQETWIRSLDWEDPMEKGMKTHPGFLAWRIPWTRSLAGYSPWGHKESNMTEHTYLLFRWTLRNSALNFLLIEHQQFKQQLGNV